MDRSRHRFRRNYRRAHRYLHDILTLYPSTMSKIPITVAHGDGIGPEIMDASLQIIQAAGAGSRQSRPLKSAKRFISSGNSAGIEPRSLGVAAPHKGFLQSAHHHSAGRRLQKPQRNRAQTPRSLRQHSAVRLLPSLCGYEAPEDERRHRARKQKKTSTRASNTVSRPT